MKKENIIIRKARRSDFWEIARLHIYQYTRGIPLKSEHWHKRARFYYDKLQFFTDINEGEIFVADVDGHVAGFLTVTTDWRVFNRKMFLSLRAARIALNLALFQYGVNPGFLKWLYYAPFRFMAYAFRKIIGKRPATAKTNTGTTKEETKEKKGDTPRLENLPILSPVPARLISIAIHTRYRRRGIARRFAKAAIKHSFESGQKECGGTVHVATIPVLNLYYSLGFAVKGRCMTSYGECLVLVKQLGEDVISEATRAARPPR